MTQNTGGNGLLERGDSGEKHKTNSNLCLETLLLLSKSEKDTQATSAFDLLKFILLQTFFPWKLHNTNNSNSEFKNYPT